MRRSLALSFLVFAFVAANAFATGEARINGTVFDGSTKKPIPNATILVVSADSGHNFKQEFKAKGDGSYAIFLLNGTIKYKFTYSAPGYQPYEQTLKLQLAPEKNLQDIDLSPQAAAAPAAKEVQPTADPAIVAYNEGANLANEGKFAEAIAKIEEAVTKKPDLTTGYETLARLYLRTKAYDKAIDAANKVLAVDTDNTDMNVVLFDSYTAKGDKAKAAEYKTKVPANAAATYNEAVPLLNAGKYKEAEKLLKQVIEIDPKFAVAYYQLGIVGMQNGDMAAAKANFQKYLELDPNGKDADVAKEALKSLK